MLNEVTAVLLKSCKLFLRREVSVSRQSHSREFISCATITGTKSAKSHIVIIALSILAADFTASRFKRLWMCSEMNFWIHEDFIQMRIIKSIATSKRAKCTEQRTLHLVAVIKSTDGTSHECLWTSWHSTWTWNMIVWLKLLLSQESVIIISHDRNLKLFKGISDWWHHGVDTEITITSPDRKSFSSHESDWLLYHSQW